MSESPRGALKRPSRRAITANGILRLMGFLGDLCIGHAFFYYLSSFEEYEALYSGIYKFLGLYFPSLKAYLSLSLISTLIMVFFVTQFIRFWGTLCFGVSIGQFLSGLRGKGQLVWKRVGGGARVLIETILGPFLIFELAPWLGRKSFKEMLSFTEIINKGGVRAFFFKTVGLPVFLLISLFSPLLQNLTLIDGLRVSFSKGNSIKIAKGADFTRFKLYPSNRFRFKSFSSLAEGRFLILPSFEVSKIAGRKKISPYIRIYDKENKRIGIMKLGKKFSLLDIIRNGKNGNPLFAARYPELTKILKKSGKVYERQLYTKGDGLPLINPLGIEEIEEFIKSSFELSFSKMFGHILQNGPFVKGYVEVRNTLLRHIRKGAIPEVDIVELGSSKSFTHRFLRFRQSYEEQPPNGKGFLETFIPIGTNNSVLLEIGWDMDLPSALSRNKFFETFLNSCQWYFDFKNIFPFPKGESEMKPFHIVDYFTKRKQPVENVKILEEYIYHYYFDLGRVSLDENDEVLGNSLTSTLNRYYIVAKLMNKIDKDTYSKNFFEQIVELKKAINNKDRGYFNL